MALFDFLNRGKIRQLESQMQALINQAQYEWWVNNGVPNYMNDDPHEYLEKGYQSNASVFGIITHINNMRKQALFRLVDENGKDIENHELLKFLNKVNENTTTDEFIGQLIIFYLTIGEFFVAKSIIDAGLNKGKVFDLSCLPSADVEIIEGDYYNPVRGYKIEGNYNIELPKETVYHGKIFNPNWFREQSLHGMSPLRAAAKVVSKLNQIEETEQKGYENQGPPYILQRKSTPDSNIQNQVFTDQQREQLESQIKKKTGTKYKGLPLIGKIPLEKIDLGSSITDMNTIESSNSGIVSLCNVYGFPPELAGYGEKTYSNMATARKAAWTDCIIPLMKVIQDCFNESLINKVDAYKNQNIKFIFDFSEVEELSEGMGVKVGWMVQAGWSGNMIYEATGQPLSDNPIMNEPRLPMGTTLASDYNATEELDNTLKSFEDYK